MNSKMENYAVVDGYLQDGYQLYMKNGQFRFEGRLVTVGNRGGRHAIPFRVVGNEAHKAFMLAKAGQEVRMNGYIRTSHYGLLLAAFGFEQEVKPQTPADLLEKATRLYAAENGPQSSLIINTQMVDRGEVDAGPYGEVDTMLPEEDDDDGYYDPEDADPWEDETSDDMSVGLVEEIDTASVVGHEAERGLSPVDPEAYR